MDRSTSRATTITKEKKPTKGNTHFPNISVRSGTEKKSSSLLSLEKSLVNSVESREELCNHLREEKKSLERRAAQLNDEIVRLRVELNEKMDIFLQLCTMEK